MQLDVLREFLTLAKTLNYHTAARELHLSQPTLSNHISSLEKELSFSLIDRSHGVRLTEAGAVFLEWAAGTIANFDKTLERCKTIARERQLSFSVQIPPLIDTTTAAFIERIRQFKESHPQASVNILPVRDKYVLDEVQNGYCDCAIFLEQATEPEIDGGYQGLKLARLCQGDAVAWMHRNNPLATKPDLSLRDLAESPIPVHVNNNARVWEMALENDFAACGVKPTFSYRYATSPEEFVLNQLHDDDVLVLPSGYMDLPLYRLRDDWVAVSFNPRVVTRGYVVYREDEGKSALLEFVQYVEDRYQASYGFDN